MSSGQGGYWGQSDSRGLREGEALGSQGGELMVRESWQGAAEAMQTPKEQNTIQLRRIKTANTRKTKGGNAYGGSHGVAGGEGAGAPAPTAAGVSMSILYRAWPWAWGKGCPSPRHVSKYPEVEGRKAGSTGANRLNCPCTPVGNEPRGHDSGCSLIPGELMLPPGTATAQREWGCPRGLSLPAARPAALGRGGDRLRPFRGQIQGTSTFLQSMKVNQLCPALAF